MVQRISKALPSNRINTLQTPRVAAREDNGTLPKVDAEIDAMRRAGILDPPVTEPVFAEVSASNGKARVHFERQDSMKELEVELDRLLKGEFLPKDIRDACLNFVQVREKPRLPKQIRELFSQGKLFLTASVDTSTDEPELNLTIKSRGKEGYHSILVEYVGWVIENFINKNFPGTNVGNDIKVRVKKEVIVTNADLGADDNCGYGRSYGDRLAAADGMFRDP